MSLPAATRIVYLFGAGSTQAEVSHRGGEPLNMLMLDSTQLGEGVSTRVLKSAPLYSALANAAGGMAISPVGDGRDIEKMISLFAATGLSGHRDIAAELRKSYFEVLVNGLHASGVLDDPQLAILLLELHKDSEFSKKEDLSGILTLNHDNLFQVASRKVHGEIRLGFDFESSEIMPGSSATPLVLQLHGAFNWTSGKVIHVDVLSGTSAYSADMEWIPPSILKEYKDYPYNKLNAIAYELLTRECDVLRLVGCSLSQNDWNVISLLFNSQYRSLVSGTPFRIELIMAAEDGNKLARSCSYLYNTVPMSALEGREFKKLKGWNPKEDGPSPEAANPFEYWLEEKIRHHVRQKELDHRWLSRLEPKQNGGAP